MIERLLIKNFKCIDELELLPGMINVIVGRNNTGKTSILQAIESYYNLKPSKQKVVIVAKEEIGKLKYLIKFGQSEAVIKINDKPLKLYINDAEFFGVLGEMFKKREKVKKWLQLLKEDYIFSERNGKTTLFLPLTVFLIPSKILEKIPEKEAEVNLLTPKELDSNVSEFEEAKDKKSVKLKMSVEKTIEKYNIEDIERFQNGYVVMKNGDIIPLELFGDGFIQMVILLYHLEKSKDIALLDEPVAFMHPGYVEKFVEYLIEIVKRKNLQVFISTHNIDFLDALTEYEDSFLNDSLKIIRLTRIKNKISAKTLSFKEAKEEKEELFTDLRGI